MFSLGWCIHGRDGLLVLEFDDQFTLGREESLAVHLHETLFGVRDGVVVAAWPVLCRGKIH